MDETDKFLDPNQNDQMEEEISKFTSL